MTTLLVSNPIRVAAVLCVICVLVLGTWHNSGATNDEIKAVLRKPFRIVLTAAIGSTGYSWSAEFDKASLKLEESWYEKPDSKLLGASGKQVFMFVPLKTGNTTIKMRLARPWESSSVEAKVYQIFVSPN